MTTMKATYKGGLRVECEHSASGTVLITDAPVDNKGQGRSFSPTDLLATSLGACLLTIMGIYADTIGVDITGAEAEITKTMGAAPRHVAELDVRVKMPAKGYSQEEKTKLERAGLTCPVHNTLKGNVVMNIRFDWGE
ncbi:MAG: OsmC family protein [Bacteroides sp.]|nr:OsmC family protein [Bacteroides sp.]MCM1084822.1 OsmC family protein [Bacteroides sp.]